MAVVENSSAPTNRPKLVQATKLRSLARSRWKNGCLAVMVWTMNTQKPPAAMMASIQISREPNQSWLGPRSVISWKAQTKVIREPKPRKSNGRSLPPAVVRHE